MTFAVFLCLVFVTLKITNGQPPGGAPTFTCQIGAGPSNDLTITYTASGTFVRMYVIGHGDTAGCNDAVVGDGLSIALTGLDNTTPQCGIQLDAPTGVPTANIELYLTQSTTNLLVNSDYIVTITAADCDFANPNPDQTPVTSALTITDSLQAVAATVVTEAVTLTLVDEAAHGVDVNGCTMGNSQRLKLSMALPSATGAVTGIHPTSCTAKSNAAVPTASDTLDLLTTSCSAATVGMTANNGFTPNGALPTADPTTAFVTVMSEAFECFRFSGTNDKVVFECTVEFCTTTLGSTRCDGDSCTNVGNTLRRKRDVTGNSTESLTTSVTINVGDYRSSSPAPTHQGCSGGFLHQTTFIVTVTILAVLLVLSMGATVYVAKKSRSASSNPPSYQPKGADNPAF